MLGARTATTLAIAGALAFGPAACGGGGGGKGDGGTADAIRAAVVRAATARSVAVKCEHSLTTDLIRRTYGSLAACRRVEASSTDEPADDADVEDIRTTAGGAHVSVKVHGGDNDGSEGGLTLRRESGEWRISDFDVDFLRSELEHGLLNTREVAAFRDPAVRSCLIGALDRGNDARFRRLAYGAMGQRPDALRRIFRAMAGCSSHGRSVLRLTFEEGIAEQLGKDRRTKGQTACVIARLRRSVSEAEVLAAVGAEAADRAKVNAVAKKVAAALTVCTGGRPPTRTS